jgi:hypothetical protein
MDDTNKVDLMVGDTTPDKYIAPVKEGDMAAELRQEKRELDQYFDGIDLHITLFDRNQELPTFVELNDLYALQKLTRKDEFKSEFQELIKGIDTKSYHVSQMSVNKLEDFLKKLEEFQVTEMVQKIVSHPDSNLSELTKKELNNFDMIFRKTRSLLGKFLKNAQNKIDILKKPST